MKVFEFFSRYAHSKGYKYALPGSYLYTKNRTKLVPYIELISSRKISSRKNKIMVFESGKGRYEVSFFEED